MEFFLSIIAPIVAFGIILSLAGIAGMLSEKVGIVNIGINGIMIIGAVFYSTYAHVFDVKSGWIQLLLIPLAGLTGLIFSWLHAFATINLKSNQVISGVAINILALGIALLMLSSIDTSQNKIGYPTEELALSTRTSDWKNIFSLKLMILIVVSVFVMVFLNKTKWGLRFSSIGENPQAADVAGINVNRMKWFGVSLSGFIAGIAGAIYSANVGFDVYKGDVQGLGFLALAIMIMGQWKTSFIIIAAFGFAIINRLGFTIPFTNEPSLQWLKQNIGQLLSIVSYVVTIIVLAIFSKRSKAPKAAGLSYDKSLR